MYSTCLFCRTDLGRNEVLEEFPVGRRVAFDLARGRLWVVCRSCERWNLSPLEERWEAMEACERLFGATRLRVSTENVGLARLTEGLELVRVGAPQRPEMAAWRYGDQFGRRRRRAFVAAGMGLGAFGAVVAGGAAIGMGMSAFAGFYGTVIDRVLNGDPKRIVASVAGEDGERVQVRRRDTRKMRLISEGVGGHWRLELKVEKREVVVRDEDAVRASAGILPALNRFGGSKRHVATAVEFLEHAGDVHATFREAARVAAASKRAVDRLPYDVRLAMEMAAHEQAERRALEGELAELERAWRDAEEIAEISDNLLVPSSVERWIRGVRGG